MSATTLVVLAVLATLPRQPPQQEPRSGPVSRADPAPSDFLRVEAGSELQTSPQEADAEAELRLRQSLLDAVINRVEVQRGVLSRRLPQLLYDSSVRHAEHTETVQKPYGVFYRKHVAVAVPHATIQRWASEAAGHQRLRVLIRGGAAALTVLAWLCGWGVAVRLDRWTRGYCFPGVVLGTLAVMLFISGAGWGLLLM